MAGPQPNGNGNNAGGNNSALYNNAVAMNNNVMPSAGHYADTQTLMQSMEQLSGWLQQNREEWLGLQEGLSRVERMTGVSVVNGGAGVNGVSGTDWAGARHLGMSAGLANGGDVEGEGETDAVASAMATAGDDVESDQPPTLTSLTHALHASQSRIATLEHHVNTHEKLNQMYESTLSETTSRLRNYIFDQQNYIISIHKHYTSLLEQSRSETVEAQLVHQRWQESLGRLSEGVRGAFGEREEERRPWVGRLKGVREENRVLRRKVGWEEVSEEDSEAEELEEVARRGRGASGNGVAARGEGLLGGYSGGSGIAAEGGGSGTGGLPS
ncbi:hypothetical protein LTR86_005953 [Recurvomyces mirabilis]|nr:hypothetical protein LTR86_005953 [Recurvomyces mirabilis]